MQKALCFLMLLSRTKSTLTMFSANSTEERKEQVTITRPNSFILGPCLWDEERGLGPCLHFVSNAKCGSWQLSSFNKWGNWDTERSSNVQGHTIIKWQPVFKLRQLVSRDCVNQWWEIAKTGADCFSLCVQGLGCDFVVLTIKKWSVLFQPLSLDWFYNLLWLVTCNRRNTVSVPSLDHTYFCCHCRDFLAAKWISWR